MAIEHDGNKVLGKPKSVVVSKTAAPIDWSNLVKSEDWWAIWVGFFVMLLGIVGILTAVPGVKGWTNIGTVLSANLLGRYLLVGLGILLITLPVIKGKGESIKKYLVAFPLVFVLGLVAVIISKNDIVGKQWGLEYAIWALVLGLLISNTLGTPKWLRPAVKAELFIKVGLVLLGASILFQNVLKVGPLAVLQSVIVILAVFFFCYFLAIKTGLSKSLATTMSAAVSICGVSAAIAAGGAAKADKKEISYTTSLVLIISIPLLILMPIIGRLLGFSDTLAGAWIGGVIDTTPAVAAAGSVYGKAALDIAVIVKMAQNLFIGVAALLIALYFAFKVEKNPTGEKPGFLGIWFRFPKFILGFIAASLLFSLVLVPAVGATATNAIISNVTESLRGWLFALAFVCIGLETRLTDIVSMGKGKPFLVFAAAETFNIFWTLAIAYLVFGGLGR